MPTLPDKKLVMLHLLEDAWVYVDIDPRRDGVALPDHLRQQPHLRLQYGYNMPMPIVDLTIDDRGISATLSFQRTPHATFIPWSAVFAMSDGDKRGMEWEDEIPPELRAGAEQAPPPPAPVKPPPATKPARPRLVSVDRLEREEAEARAAAERRPSAPGTGPTPVPAPIAAASTASPERRAAATPIPLPLPITTAPGASPWPSPAPGIQAAPEPAAPVEPATSAPSESATPAGSAAPAAPTSSATDEEPPRPPTPGSKRTRPSHLKLVD